MFEDDTSYDTYDDISNEELYVLKAIIAKSIGCGNFLFVDEGDLGFSLI